jgi:hypothetical protein
MSTFSQKQAQETGIAISLIVFLVAYLKSSYQLLPVGIILLGISLFWPYGFRLLFAPVWFLLTKIVGPFFSYALLIMCFFCIITPIGLLRRLLATDPLQMKKWKKGHASILKVRDQSIQANHIDKPF